MKKNNCDDVNPDLRLCAGKHGNRMSAYDSHLSNMPIVILFAESDGKALRTRAAIAFRVSDADRRGN